MKKTLFILFFIFMFMAISALTCTASHAGEDRFLPGGLSWGADSKACETLLVGSGYEKARGPLLRTQGERELHRSNRLNGLSEAFYVKTGGEAAENITILLFEDAMFKITIDYIDVKPGFKDGLVSRLNEAMPSSPRGRRSGKAGMEFYAWDEGPTGAQLNYQELPRISHYFAVLSYFHSPSMKELKKIGLQ
jgi:hypothetical protein